VVIAASISMLLLSVLGVLGGCLELPRLMTEAEAAAALGVRPATLQAWRTTKRVGLPYLKISRLIRYREADVLAHLNNCLRGVQPAAG